MSIQVAPICQRGGLGASTTTETPTTSTTATTTAELPEHCTNYNVLESHSRNYMVTEHNFCSGTYCCNQAGYEHVRPEWKGDGWYRITGQAGTKIIDSPVDVSHCGTAATGWLSGEHPSPGEGVVTRRVCFNYDGNPCNWKADVDVLNCNDAYYD